MAAEAFVRTPPPLIVNATAIPGCDTAFPPASNTCTVTAGETGAPTTTLAGGCWLKVSCDGAPAATANRLLIPGRNDAALAVSA